MGWLFSIKLGQYFPNLCNVSQIKEGAPRDSSDLQVERSALAKKC